jgi:hypothetical protein
VDTGKCRFYLDARNFRPFSRVQFGEEEILEDLRSETVAIDAKGMRHTATIDEMRIESGGPLRVTLFVRGRLASVSDDVAIYFGRLHFYRGSSLVRIDFTVRNPRAARHPRGLWDLGDPGSLFLRELAIVFRLKAGAGIRYECAPVSGTPPVVADGEGNLVVYQESSGGKNWRSPNHRNRSGTIPLSLDGYEITVGGRRVTAGGRAEPVSWCGSGAVGVGVYIPGFWENFPKSVEVGKDLLRVGLFPARFPDLHELQGGEQKTHTVLIDFSVSERGLDWAREPLYPVASEEIYRSSGVVPDLPGENDLVDRFLSGPESLLAKRETVDEYGWRNFGDVDADHEGVYHRGPEPFISHYNNQYDLLAGLLRKFMVTGNRGWGRIAAELARHVCDIDIYHTEDDREEYNQGLFWHTNHYISAGLATHRSFSREHHKTMNPKNYGGGPGAEHCYTTGLMLSYLMTGEIEYRQAVLDLADWCLRSLNGPQTIFAASKRGVSYLARLHRKKNGTPSLFPRYPLTRGTGNAITACLDAFEAGGGRPYLEQVGELIQGTLHPEDPIDARDLLNAEIAWSYTVLLAAVAKYLDKKKELDEIDGSYAHAKASLLAYAEWMIQHEYPYLEKPENLEYPNETWAAQDLRKAVVLYHAARYARPGSNKSFLEKAHTFLNLAQDELIRHPSSCFTRPVALILQNGWVGSRLENQNIGESGDRQGVPYTSRPTPWLNIHSVAVRIGREFGRAARETSIKREVAWLKARVV